jgi:succinate dehydrogenase / fumarate reductase flavoprotein subunit
VFLDIAWIKEKMPNAAEHIKRKLPSMYHQFKELAGVDITKEPMEVGPTTHYIMGGVKVDADTQMTSVPGLFATGECAAGLHGANRLGGNSLSDLLVFGKRAGEYAAKYAKEIGDVKIDAKEIEDIARLTLSPFDREADGENPFELQNQLQDMMQDLVGIVRTESDLDLSIEKLKDFESRAANAGCNGNRGYNPGWHTAIELSHMITVAKAIAYSAKERKESRGGHFREDFPDKSEAFAKMNTTLKKDASGNLEVMQVPIKEVRDDLKQIIEEMK